MSLEPSLIIIILGICYDYPPDWLSREKLLELRVCYLVCLGFDPTWLFLLDPPKSKAYSIEPLLERVAFCGEARKERMSRSPPICEKT